ncbi:hydroxypyruvate reductase [Cupriavidus basilensis OR16]|uniref:Hydroxypyruvate reductase n=1 Tax=Cupriavidus basilensis OR16 TaxID=1127483 RepID=H1RZ60_9BURK|nr:hydroxypyruvate reductase [Cupriavidus basilensis OR16]
MADHLPPPQAGGRTLVVGAGKAAASMALAVERAYAGHNSAAQLDGLVVTRYAHGLPTAHVRVIEAGHPVPDEAGERAAAEILARASELGPDDRLIVLVSGGGCAIASGPTVPDPSTYADAQAILRRYGAVVPPAVQAYLERGARGEVAETPKPGDPLFSRVENRVIATAHGSLVAAAEHFRARGIQPVVLGDTVTGEAQEVARVYAALVREIRAYNAPFAAPVVLISGGECTVTLPQGGGGAAGKPRGGRCSEFLLSLALELDGADNIYAIAADTDGIDGSEDNAGALLDPSTLARAQAAGAPARARLDAHDAWGFFEAAGDLVVTGPTRTNVNDYRAILIL